MSSYTTIKSLQSLKSTESDGSVYYGKKNEKGKKDGYGCLVFPDGSY